MISIGVPGFAKLELEYLVLDFNGTLAVDGGLIQGVAERIEKLAGMLEVHVVTADTFGRASQELEGLPCKVEMLSTGNEAGAKAAFVNGLGANKCVAVGNGANDEFMLGTARLGIAVTGTEGAAVKTLIAANVLVAGLLDALDLLLNPMRLKATLRR